MKITVLMSTYNGEKYIKEQIESLLSQDIGDFKLLIRDDGSKDNTVNILEDYSSKYSFIKYYYGNNIGPAKSFWKLINDCEESDYYALCDQDDVWFSDKLSTAVKMLSTENKNIPLLYLSKFTLTDENLNPINSDISKLYSFSDFPHSLIYHTAPGCTFVFNNEARKKIIQYDIEKEYCVIHDSLIHKIVGMFGKVILDNTSHMYYRQHGNNEIGMSANVFKVYKGRINRLLTGKLKNYRSLTAKSLLNTYGDECSKDNRELLELVACYSNSLKQKKKLISCDCFKTHTINDLFFMLMVLVNYI